jgi:hypothetical protein
MSDIRRKSPFISGVLSIIFPGAGQLYNEDFSKGIIMFVATIATIAYIVYSALALGSHFMNGEVMPQPVLIVRVVITALFLFGIWLYGIIDAIIYAQRSRNSTVAPVSAPENTKEGAIALGVVLVIIGVVAILVQIGLKFEYIIKYGAPIALVVLGGYLLAKTSGLIKGGE